MLNRLMGMIAVLLAVLVASAGAKENILYSFKGGADGGSPHSGLAHDKLGNLYGVTSKGGQGQCFGLGCGTVFELTRKGDGTWTKSTLHTFDGGQGGGVPVGTLAIDARRNLYGVTEQGGTGPCDSVLGGGCGVIYRLSPQRDGSWVFSVLYSFSQPFTVDDGEYPSAGVVLDQAGNLYGTTEFGGSFACDCGTVYRLTPTQVGTWTEVVLYSFVGISQGGSDVSFPASPVTLDGDGNIFGTGTGGGDVLCNLGCGGVFVLVPRAGGYDEQVLHIFEGGSDGSQPETGVILDSSGNLYGTTGFGGGGTGCANGDHGCGTVFELKATGGDYQTKILFRFDGPNGYAPFGELVLDHGNLYGTTEGGGAVSAGAGFRLSPVAGEWRETGFHSFGTGTDGALPISGVIGNPKLGFFGTTAKGGEADWGTVFQFK